MTANLWSFVAEDNTRVCIATLSGYTAPVVILVVGSVFQLAISNSQDSSCHVWNLTAQGVCSAALVGLGRGVRTVGLVLKEPAGKAAGNGAAKGQLVVSDGVDGKVIV